MKQIGIMGPALNEYPENEKERERIEQTAERIGKELASAGAIVITGGCDGVMEAALRGAKKAGGITVGTPGRTRGISNKYVDVEIITEIDTGSLLFAGLPGCDALIFIPRGAGTLAELCIAYRLKKPVVILKGFDQWYDSKIGTFLDNGKCIRLYGAADPAEAARLALKLAENKSKGDQV